MRPEFDSQYWLGDAMNIQLTAKINIKPGEEEDIKDAICAFFATRCSGFKLIGIEFSDGQNTDVASTLQKDEV